MKDIYILGIETSCDETAVAIVKNGRDIVRNIVASQIDIHKKFGGVVPEVASRNHVVDINNVILECMNGTEITWNDISGIAVTYGPGLVGALLVGLSAAKGLSIATGIPLIGVNHIEGHIAANYIAHKELEPPFVSLIVSGGHSHIVEVNSFNQFKILGKTVDDAVGEAYDKVARVLGLGYPGGPKIDNLSKEGKNIYSYPKAFYHDDNYDFSFSGIKSAVLNHINSLKMKNEEIVVEDIAASFQNTVVDVLCNKAIKAALNSQSKKLVVCGGVSANSGLREELEKRCKENNISFYYPPLNLCTDNGAMIAACGYYSYLRKEFSDYSLNAKPNLKIGEK